jgi:hypothetical protein
MVIDRPLDYGGWYFTSCVPKLGGEAWIRLNQSHTRGTESGEVLTWHNLTGERMTDGRLSLPPGTRLRGGSKEPQSTE